MFAVDITFTTRFEPEEFVIESAVPPFVPRRFINITPGEGREEGLLLTVQPGNVAKVEYM